MRDNNEIRFPITSEFKEEVKRKIKEFSPDLKVSSSFKKLFLIGWFSFIDNLTKNKNLLNIPLKSEKLNKNDSKNKIKH